MRLRNIKLAGFKSFVDPTTIPFFGNLTAVVGPNGCGKSNVIDAVRWVMGESSAKHLRGGALTDVIFSGAASRKPVGQATVELLFDNSEGKLGGEYSNYAEIAIKRQVTRDGQSNYFLNGQRCRRRDVTDIFLGTGLGPRSYAIIEQGMISRVIEAKPEDLRVFIEEAAGISKYKERRRETENRIQHTQANLARLTDLREELGQQINRLARQAEAAERYKEFNIHHKELTAQLAALTWRRIDAQIQLLEERLRKSQTQLEAKQADAQRLKTQQEKDRLIYTEVNESLSEVQKRYYSVGSDITRIEQSVLHHQQRDEQLKADKSEFEQSLAHAQSQLDADLEKREQLQSQIEELEPQHQQRLEEAEQAMERQQEAEGNLEEWRDKTTQCQQASLGPTKLAESAKAKITQLEGQIHQAQNRLNRLELEKQTLQTQHNTFDMATFEEKESILEQQQEQVNETLAALVLEKENVMQAISLLRSKLKACQQALNEKKGEQSALMTLQEAALGKNEAVRNAWLSSMGLDKAPSIYETLQAQPGWELALETVLEGVLQAKGLVAGTLRPLIPHLSELKEVGVHLVEWSSACAPIAQGTLMSQLRSVQNLPSQVVELLSKVRICQNLVEVSEQLSELSESESLITPQGYWFGKGWVKIRSQTQESGLLHREERIKQLTQEINSLQEASDQLQSEIEKDENKLSEIERDKDIQRQEKNRYQQEIAMSQSEKRLRQSQLEQTQKRLAQIQEEMEECQTLVHTSQGEVNASRVSLQTALEEMAHTSQQQEELMAHKNELNDALANARLKAKEAAAIVHQIALTLQGCRTQVNAFHLNVERFKVQIENTQHKLENMSDLIEKNAEPVFELKQEREGLLENRLHLEQELSQARNRVAQTENALRESEQQVQAYEQDIHHLREACEQIKLQWQTLSVHRENALEKLKNIELSLEQLLNSLPLEATEKDWQAQMDSIEQKIQRLGAINLAAIEEYQTALERKTYLDSQCLDLTEALSTLENAIKKIDRETRAKFKETFDKINHEFTQFFPRLFGGGQAYLSMTGEELLDTGISLMARPPGKKNSMIQQLSGGEKALTAVALVFSIFALNPAPFCILDEVDAPLDDNNVGRFCNLVREMSTSVQFIYISHNKLAIEMAEQLQGVTMREPGVSRLVTVDIEEAKSMAHA